MKTNVEVVATNRITEKGFNGAKQWTHAKPGGVGLVLAVNGDWLTVAFGRSVTDCHRSDVKALRRKPRGQLRQNGKVVRDFSKAAH